MIYDAIVVGARCAGSPTAMLLARKGHRVLLCDKAAFPSDTISNGAFNIPGPQYLRRWGLFDRVVATGVPVVKSIINHVGGNDLRVELEHPFFAPMRRILDDLLVEAALEAGAELREKFRISDLVVEEGRVVGVKGGDKDSEERARIVIGADGRRSTVARRLKAREYDHVPMTGGGVYTYFEDVPTSSYEFWVGGRGWAMLAPSNYGLTHVATAGNQVDGTTDDRFEYFLSAYPDLKERVSQGVRRSRLVAYRDAPVFFRQAYGPGWALVGDAGFHQGPWNGYGMSHAFRDAERLAGAVQEWLSGSATFEEALGGYERDRNEWCQPFRDNISAIISALERGRPQEAPWGGEWPHVERWVERILSEPEP